MIDTKSIELWELLYHLPGGVAVCAAVKPFINFYIIVNYHLQDPFKIEKFYGPNALDEINQRALDLGLDRKFKETN